MPAENPPSFREAARFWFRLGWISFGGPVGQIAIMHDEVVDRRRWMKNERFLHALNFCMLLPGPEAQQLATYIGWAMHGVRGGVVAGLFFILPSTLILWLLSVTYVYFGQTPLITSVFDWLKPAVIAIVAAAALRTGQKTLRTRGSLLTAAAAFLLIHFTSIPFPIIILGAALASWLRAPPAKGEPSEGAGASPRSAPVPAANSIRLALVCLALWAAPLVLLWFTLGPGSVPFQQGVFFSKTAVVTFGGAYAVLPYVAERAVEGFGWLSANQMMDGLALAETTPGPLIMVLQFVGFLGGWQHPGGLSPLVAATLCSAVTVWVTFVPCFLWVLTGAPYIDRLRGVPRLTATLSGVTAAVCGVIAHLAVWFSTHALFPAGGVRWDFCIAAAVALYLISARKWPAEKIVFCAGAVGLAMALLEQLSGRG